MLPRFSIRSLLILPVSVAILYAVHSEIPYDSMAIPATGYCLAGLIPCASLGYDVERGIRGWAAGAFIGAALGACAIFIVSSMGAR